MSFNSREFINISDRRLEELSDFLERMGLHYEGGAEFTVILYDDDDEIVGTGSLCGCVLKYIAVTDELQGEGASAAIVSRLVSHAYMIGRKKLFLFTKPQNRLLFTSLGFFAIAETDSVVYMENSRNGLKDYLASLKQGSGVQGAVVVNCNPFTFGHRYLLETAASMVDTLHVFVVSEDRSDFPFSDRFELVRKGSEDISNLILHESGDYIISHATFPTYFMKKDANTDRINAELDLALFGERIAPALNITERFVGTEPYCNVTRAYNECMKQLLPKYGVQVVEIERLDGISASKVREAVGNGDWQLVKKLVPQSTYDYLLEKGDKI